MQAAKPLLSQSNGQPKRPNRYNLKFHTSAPNCPSTRRTPALYAHEYIEKPGVARGNLAASTTRPHGNTEYMRKYRDYVGSFLSSSTRAELTRSRPHYNNTSYSGTEMAMAWYTPGIHTTGFVIWGLISFSRFWPCWWWTWVSRIRLDWAIRLSQTRGLGYTLVVFTKQRYANNLSLYKAHCLVELADANDKL